MEKVVKAVDPLWCSLDKKNIFGQKSKNGEC